MTIPVRRKLSVWLFVAGLFSIPLMVWAYDVNPPLGMTGAPGSPDNGRTCSTCHRGGTGGGKISITSSSGTTYHPGTTQRLTVTISDPNAKAWGYEITAVKALSPYPGAGVFKAVDTKSGVGKSGTRSYGFQKNDQIGQKTSVKFLINWTPPAKSVGNITLYVAGVGERDTSPPDTSSVYKASLTLKPK